MEIKIHGANAAARRFKPNNSAHGKVWKPGFLVSLFQLIPYFPVQRR